MKRYWTWANKLCKIDVVSRFDHDAALVTSHFSHPLQAPM